MNSFSLLTYNIGLSVLIGGILVILLSLFKLIALYKSKNPSKVGLFGIWLMGLLTLLIGILNQVINIRNAFSRIAEAGDVNAALFAGSIRLTFGTTTSGLLVLIISLVFWGILKGIKNSRISN